MTEQDKGNKSQVTFSLEGHTMSDSCFNVKKTVIFSFIVKPVDYALPQRIKK